MPFARLNAATNKIVAKLNFFNEFFKVISILHKSYSFANRCGFTPFGISQNCSLDRTKIRHNRQGGNDKDPINKELNSLSESR